MSRSRKVVFGYSSAIVAAALFGSVPTVAKPVLTNINPILLSSLVYLVSGATFTPLAYRSKKKTVHRKYYVLVIMTGIIGAAIAPVLFFQGLKQTTAGDTSLLANGETVFSILFALLLFGEKLNTKVYLAIILILAGLFIVTTNLKFDSTILNLNSGNILVIGATVLWGLDNNISKIITRHMEIARVVQLKSLIGGGILLIVVLAGGLPLTIQYNQILPIIIVGVLGIAFSLFLYLQAIKKIGVAKSSSILSLSAVFGLAFAGIFLAEQISHYQLIAIIVMFVGVYMMYKSEEKKDANQMTNARPGLNLRLVATITTDTAYRARVAADILIASGYDDVFRKVWIWNFRWVEIRVLVSLVKNQQILLRLQLSYVYNFFPLDVC